MSSPTLTISPASATLEPGQVLYLEAQPSDGSDAGLLWSRSPNLGTLKVESGNRAAFAAPPNLQYDTDVVVTAMTLDGAASSEATITVVTSPEPSP
jgi:hypothetical protein